MTITMDLDRMLDAVAISRRIVVLTHEGGEKGRYYHPRLISLRAGLGPVNRRCTLAHELAHAIHGDDPAATGWLRARQEARADQQAADWLIDPAAYAEAEALHGPHPGALAAELGVTVHLVQVWRDHMVRARTA